MAAKETAPAAEATPKDKAKAFSELASSRLTKAVSAVELLANLANTTNYTYTPEQVAKISAHLDNAVKYVKDAFTAGGVKKADQIAI